jgi:formylglycine-generating enzyme required for sulfatase activity
MTASQCVKSLGMIPAIAIATSVLAVASLPDDPGRAEKPPVPMIGDKAGRERADNGLEMKLVWCPPGTFTMGSPNEEKDRDSNEDPVEVTLTRGYWLGKFEVTRAQWKQVMGNEPWTGWIRAKLGDDVPATFIRWKDALEFGRKLTEQEREAGRLTETWQYTLPTEAQWEYAFRAETKGRYPFEDSESSREEHGWWPSMSAYMFPRGDEYARLTHPVGQKKANPWGLYDMYGNVKEWCRDDYKEKLPGGFDPEVHGWGGLRVNRFGRRSAGRNGDDPNTLHNDVGFRVVLGPATQTSGAERIAASEPENRPRGAPAAMIGAVAGDERDDNWLKLKLVWCPPGTFTMGSPKDARERDFDEGPAAVTLTRGFWLGKYEVTQAEWERVMDSLPWKPYRNAREGDNYPAVYVRWDAALAFCRKLTALERKAGRLPDDWEYTPPTEAYWEYACRAGTETAYGFGDAATRLGDFAWWGRAADGGSARNEPFAHPVGARQQNAWGLCDMHGNVAEWCRDVYQKKLPGGEDPEVVFPGASNRVVRGGAWITDSFRCRSAYRVWESSGRYSPIQGLRIALSPVSEVVAPPQPALDPDVAAKIGSEREDNGLTMKFVWCPPGRFTMGSPKAEQNDPVVQYNESQVQVALSEEYWLGKYEVTQGQWKQVMSGARLPWWGMGSLLEGDDVAAAFVGWDLAIAFCRKLTEMERKAGRLPKEWEYTLPTEAQWERACRAGSETAYSFGNDPSELGEYAWIRGNTYAAKEPFAHRVGQKKPNVWGLHDMHGNVAEWCRDGFVHIVPGGSDPEVAARDTTHVLRGGGWSDRPARLRSAFRQRHSLAGAAAGVGSEIGFRVALSRAAAAAAAPRAERLEFDVATEGGRKAEIRVAVHESGEREKSFQEFTFSVPGRIILDLKNLPDRDCGLTFSSKQFATRGSSIEVRKGRATCLEHDLTLFLNRYVILDYAVNLKGNRTLTGPEVEQGRCAVGYFGAVPVFNEDWHIRPKSEDGREFYGPMPWLDYHRKGAFFGFAEPPRGAVFENLTEAPAPHGNWTPDNYIADAYPAKKGVILFSRIAGWREWATKGRYGKLRIVDVVTEVPPGIRIIESPQ